MKLISERRILVLLALTLLAAPAYPQDQALQNLIHGKKFFWEAKFDQALTSLKAVTEIESARPEYLFEAYLYTGFVLLRQSAPMSEVRSVFTEAIELNPRRKPDEMVIPPDLTEPFYDVRNEIVGCLYIVTVPEGAHVVGVLGDSLLFEDTAPVTVCDVVTRDYQLLISERGYEQTFLPLALTAGKTDTLAVILHPARSGGGKKNAAKWMIRGGLAVGVGAILYKAVLESKGETLPGPPAHPSGSQ